MRLERRIPLLIALTILLPSLASHYGQSVAESRARGRRRPRPAVETGAEGRWGGHPAGRPAAGVPPPPPARATRGSLRIRHRMPPVPHPAHPRGGMRRSPRWATPHTTGATGVQQR